MKLAALTLAAACGAAPPASNGAASRASRESCAELLEHLLDLTWRAEPVSYHNDAYGEDRHEFKKDLRATRGPDFLEACGTAPPAHVNCARASEHLDAVRACDKRLTLTEP